MNLQFSKQYPDSIFYDVWLHRRRRVPRVQHIGRVVHGKRGCWYNWCSDKKFKTRTLAAEALIK